jgi:hypothetical protein
LTFVMNCRNIINTMLGRQLFQQPRLSLNDLQAQPEKAWEISCTSSENCPRGWGWRDSVLALGCLFTFGSDVNINGAYQWRISVYSFVISTTKIVSFVGLTLVWPFYPPPLAKFTSKFVDHLEVLPAVSCTGTAPLNVLATALFSGPHPSSSRLIFGCFESNRLYAFPLS